MVDAEIGDAGRYAFTVGDEHQMGVRYVGRTGHLSMVTGCSFPAALRAAASATDARGTPTVTNRADPRAR